MPVWLAGCAHSAIEQRHAVAAIRQAGAATYDIQQHGSGWFNRWLGWDASTRRNGMVSFDARDKVDDNVGKLVALVPVELVDLDGGYAWRGRDRVSPTTRSPISHACRRWD